MHNIRFATINDNANIAMLLKKAESDWNISILQACFSDAYCHYIFLNDKKIIGYLCIKKNVDFSELLQICVDPAYRRQKIATHLLLKAIADTKGSLQLEVRKSNDKAIAFYEKMDFVKVAVRKKYYSDGEDAILMDRTI